MPHQKSHSAVKFHGFAARGGPVKTNVSSQHVAKPTARPRPIGAAPDKRHDVLRRDEFQFLNLDISFRA
jgi:hypothetical protein